MLNDIKDLEACTIVAIEGPAGDLKDLYFDDVTWVVRYLEIDSTRWMARRRVLISPISVGEANPARKSIPVALSRSQIENSPDIDLHMPVSRQHEMEYHTYYGNSYYWGGGGLWGAGEFPNLLSSTGASTRVPSAGGAGAGSLRPLDAEAKPNGDPHLRSCNAVNGYHIRAADGQVGHVASFLVDAESWAIRYLVVDTSNWWLGHQVLISPSWIEAINWADSTVSVNVAREEIKFAPAYDGTESFDRQQERSLHTHHGKPGYWTDADRLDTEISRI